MYFARLKQATSYYASTSAGFLPARAVLLLSRRRFCPRRARSSSSWASAVRLSSSTASFFITADASPASVTAARAQLARPRLQHLKAKALRVVLKLVLFNAALAAIFALLLFVLTALALGMSFGAAAAGPQRLTLSLLLVVLLIVPCLWASGSAIMQDTAALWRQSAGFWAGLVLTAAALVLSLVRRQGTRAQGVLLLCGALLVRVAFFSATVHTASRLGMPY